MVSHLPQGAHNTTQTNTTEETQVCYQHTMCLLSQRHAYSLTLQMTCRRTRTKTTLHLFLRFAFTHAKTNTQRRVALTLIWRGAAFQSRWFLHVSTAMGATGLQQTSVLVMVVGGVGECEMRWGGGEGGSASVYSGGGPTPEWKALRQSRWSCNTSWSMLPPALLCFVFSSCLLAPAAVGETHCYLFFTRGSNIYDIDIHFIVVRFVCISGVVKVSCFAWKHITSVYECVNDVSGLQALFFAYLNGKCVSFISIHVCVCARACVWERQTRVLCTCSCTSLGGGDCLVASLLAWQVFRVMGATGCQCDHVVCQEQDT